MKLDAKLTQPYCISTNSQYDNSQHSLEDIPKNLKVKSIISFSCSELLNTSDIYFTKPTLVQRMCLQTCHLTPLCELFPKGITTSDRQRAKHYTQKEYELVGL